MNEKPINNIAMFSEQLQCRLIGLELDLDALIWDVELRIELILGTTGHRGKIVAGVMASYLDHVKTVRKDRGETNAQIEMRFLLAWVTSTPFWII